jgi:hypothetical protein
MKCVFGIGGGSDFHTACLFAGDEDVVLTALAPVVSKNGAIDWFHTMTKYTGRPFCTAVSDSVKQNPAYTCFKEIDALAPYLLQDNRRSRAFGIVIPPCSMTDEMNACVARLRVLIGEAWIQAVDTGGDCLRGLLPGMGDTDISHLFGGTTDTRDSDAIELINRLTEKAVHIRIVGPGSDGETSQEGLISALDSLLEGKSQKVRLLKNQSMKELKSVIDSSQGWESAREGSTLDNIKRAMATVEGSDPIPIVRKGQVVNHIRAEHLASVWEVLVTF